MASQRDKGKKNKKDVKPGLGRRLKNFFSDIKAELKRVTWPDRKRLKANTGTVIAIILMATITIFIFDTVISSVLSATGFYTYDAETEIVETVEDTDTNADGGAESDTEDETGAAE